MTDRKMILKEVTTLDIDGYLLKDVVRDLTKLLAEYGDTAKVSKEEHPHEDRWYLALLLPTPETDTEMALRLDVERQAQRNLDTRERVEYERLQAKFGKAGQR